MKILNTLLALLVFIQTNNSFAYTTSEVEYTFTKLRYELENGTALSQEQKQQQATNAMNDLLAGGVSGEQILAYVKSTIKDSKKRSDFEALLSTMQKQNLSEKETLKIVSNFFGNESNQGAAYQSGILIGVPTSLVVIAAAIVIAFAVIDARNRCHHGCAVVVY